MKNDLLEDGLLRRYLLEELPQEQADEVESRLLADDELFELAEAVEAELLASAARGELAPAAREHVLKRLASSPQGRERLAFARALNKVADEGTVVPFPSRPPASRPVVQWAAALAASLLIATGLAWYAVEKQRASHAKPPMTVTQAEKQSHPVPPKSPEKQPSTPPAATAPVPDQVAREEEPAVPETVQPLGRAFLQLALAVQRGEGSVDQVRLTPETGVLEIQLDVATFEDLESFEVTLRKEQETVWQKSGLMPRQLDWGSALVLEVPAADLAAGRYEIKIQGMAATGEAEELSPLEFEVVTGGQP